MEANFKCQMLNVSYQKSKHQQYTNELKVENKNENETVYCSVLLLRVNHTNILRLSQLLGCDVMMMRGKGR